MNNLNRKGYYRQLQFNAIQKSSEIVLSHGLVILDNARLSGCNISNIEIKLSYLKDNTVITVKKSLKNYHNTVNRTGYTVNFTRNVTVPCWVNITQPTKLKIDVSGMGGGTVNLEYFVLRLL